jgi:hypothetical protein
MPDLKDAIGTAVGFVFASGFAASASRRACAWSWACTRTRAAASARRAESVRMVEVVGDRDEGGMRFRVREGRRGKTECTGMYVSHRQAVIYLRGRQLSTAMGGRV